MRGEIKVQSRKHKWNAPEGSELAAAVTSHFWPSSGHTLANGLLADPAIEGVTVHVVPLLLSMNTVFILPVAVAPVVWLLIVPKSGGRGLYATR